MARTAHSFIPWSGPACPSLGAWSGASCGARVTHNRPGLSIASSARARFGAISRSEPTGCDGRHAGREKRTVLATPRHCEDRHADARSRRSRVWGSAWDGGPDARERRLASLCFRANPSHQPAGMIRFSTEANPHTGSQGFCRFRGTVPLSSPRGSGAAGRWSL